MLDNSPMTFIPVSSTPVVGDFKEGWLGENLLLKQSLRNVLPGFFNPRVVMTD